MLTAERFGEVLTLENFTRLAEVVIGWTDPTVVGELTGDTTETNHGLKFLT